MAKAGPQLDTVTRTPVQKPRTKSVQVRRAWFRAGIPCRSTVQNSVQEHYRYSVPEHKIPYRSSVKTSVPELCRIFALRRSPVPEP